MLRTTNCLALLVLLLSLGHVTLAEDIAPAPYRGLALSTTQEWDLLTEGRLEPEFWEYLYSPPDGTSGITHNPYGTAALRVDFITQPGLESYWQDGAGPGPGGAWFGTPFLGVGIPTPDIPVQHPLILFRVQVTYYNPSQIDLLNVRTSLSGQRWSHQTIPLGNDWWQFVEDWTIQHDHALYDFAFDVWIDVQGYPNPPETYAVSEVVIDAIPEPSTLILLSMGGLALIAGWWRRRRRA